MLYEELKSRQVHIPEGIKKIFEAVIKDGRSLVINDPDINSDLVPNGSLFIDASTSKMQVKKHGYLESILADDIFDPESVTDTILKKNAINGNRIKQRTITRDRIDTGTITADEIDNRTITGAKIKLDTIEGRHIKINSIDTNQIVDNAVTEEKVHENTINDLHIKEDAVRTRHIKSANIEEKHLAAGSISPSKIQQFAVESSHIALGNIQSQHIGAEQITEDHIKDESITNTKLAEISVSTGKIQNSAITRNKIENGAVNKDKIETRSVGYDKLEKVVEDRIKSSLDVVAGVGTLPSLNATENVLTKTLGVTNGATLGSLLVKANADINGKLHSKGDITTDGKIFRVAFNDIAEAYIPGEQLSPGDVVQIEEDGKVYKSELMSKTVVGVISDCYGDCFGASSKELESGEKIAVGMIGQVPVKIIGPVKIGDYIIPGDNGIAYPILSGDNRNAIGKAIRSSNHEGVQRVLCLIYPN